MKFKVCGSVFLVTFFTLLFCGIFSTVNAQEKEIRYPELIMEKKNGVYEVGYTCNLNLTEFNGKFYCMEERMNSGPKTRHTLWEIDQENAEVKKIKEFNYSLNLLPNYHVTAMHAFKDRLFFTGYSSQTGLEPWYMDTEGNVFAYMDVREGMDNSTTVFRESRSSEYVYLVTGKGSQYDQVWLMDSNYNVELIKEYDVNDYHSVRKIVDYPDKIIIESQSGIDQIPWEIGEIKQDNTNLGISFNNMYYFKDGGTWGRQNSDGVRENININSSHPFSVPAWTGEAANKDYLYFLAQFDDIGLELAKMDKNHNVTIAKEFVSGISGGWPEDLVNIGDEIYFSVRDSEEVEETSLWRIAAENKIELVKGGFETNSLAPIHKSGNNAYFDYNGIWRISEGIGIEKVIRHTILQRYGSQIRIYDNLMIIKDGNGKVWILDLNEDLGENTQIYIPDLEADSLNRYVYELIDEGISKGYEDGSYKPYQTITRAEFSSLIVKALKIEINDSGDAFPDLENQNVHYKPIQTLKNNGVISGYKNGTFGSDDYITREQAAKILSQVVEMMQGEKTKVDEFRVRILSDIDGEYKESDFYQYVRKILSVEVEGETLMKGYSDNVFKPKEGLTRIQMAKVIWLVSQIPHEREIKNLNIDPDLSGDGPCEELIINASLPLNTEVTSSRDPGSVVTCANVNAKNDLFDLRISVYEPGAGCLDLESPVLIGKIKNPNISVYRVYNSENDKYYYHTIYDKEEVGCQSSTASMGLEKNGALGISCEGSVGLCDEAVKSLEIIE